MLVMWDNRCLVHAATGGYQGHRPDREGDVAVISRENTCIGGSAKNHDLTGLKGHRLRTHGGVSEAKVPFILSRPLNDAYKAKAAGVALRSYQIFDYAINGTV